MGSGGSQGAAGKTRPKGDQVAPAVEIDTMFEFCKHLPIAIVEQYRWCSHARYAINLMEDIELHDGDCVQTIIDKRGCCNASQGQ